MNAPLFDDLLDQLRGAPTQQMSQRLGLSPESTMQAVATALPMLLGALHRNAQAEPGARSLLSALEVDHRGIDPANALGTALAGGGSGAGILGHVFGTRQPVAAEAVSNATGLGPDRAGMLLRLLAPVVMAYLARRLFTPREADGPTTPQPSPDGLRTALGEEVTTLRERGNVHPALLSVLDRDRDGDVDLQDFTGAAATPLATQTAEMRSPRPLL
ncbi:DUF937 domain-containing protein [Cognatilysobacter segetis]|uniref:DUF937 domain-containing protein n=1 Tax=Cognatilysobacter segetis TaxID=2492394 RepID=UPI001060394F|nr:DUF937 domain-containing protein [Lysobacter segetis]